MAPWVLTVLGGSARAESPSAHTPALPLACRPATRSRAARWKAPAWSGRCAEPPFALWQWPRWH